jgi:NifU-like protein|tara:strand:- start:23 stop:763 length:741 start_codon:yes stop_codon:yes gene_type:complete
MSVAEEKFSLNFEEKATAIKHRGAYYQEDASEKGMALLEAKFKDTKLYWLVDLKEDRIFSARFFAYGGKVSLVIGETLCTMVEGLTVDEACSLLKTDVEAKLRDEPEVPAVPESKMKAFDTVEELLKTAKEQYPSAKGVAIASASIDKADFQSTTELNLVAQAWLGLTKDEQKEQIEIVLDEHIRPALMNDGGNVQVLDVTDGEKVLVQYQGACGSCGSSLGATLSFMESTLRKHIYNDINVVPQM